MSDPRLTYVVDFTARMATQKYGKVRIKQGIGSRMGVFFLRIFFAFAVPIAPLLGAVFSAPTADFRKSTIFIGSYWEFVSLGRDVKSPFSLGMGSLCFRRAFGRSPNVRGRLSTGIRPRTFQGFLAGTNP